MDFNSKLVIRDEVFTKQVGEELILLDLTSENYFGIDAVGGDIWRLLKEGKTMQEALDVLLLMYDVDEPQLRDDVSAFVAELIERNLAEPG